jgi:putative transposase
MPRRPRVVFPHVPHHITQRGNHRERVFQSPADFQFYLWLLNVQCRHSGVEVFAYCLMPNHVHLVVVPREPPAMHRALRAVHSQYAQRVNRITGRIGHLWQGRYFSSPLDSNYFLNAVRYVELNPVRARLVTRAEDYPWSSAAAHCGHRDDKLLASSDRSAVLGGIGSWTKWLADGVPKEALENLRRHGPGNLPCGSPEFVATLERISGEQLRFRPRGRPWQENSNTKK